MFYEKHKNIQNVWRYLVAILVASVATKLESF